MAELESYPVLDFTGGVRRDKGLPELQKNELLDARNIEIIDRGRIQTRRGSYMIGDALSTNVENSFAFIRFNLSGTASTWVIVNTNGSTGVLSTITSTRLTAAITTATTTISVVSTTGMNIDFDVSGTIEIEGDIITYTGNSGTTFTGCTGIRTSHAAGASVNQWNPITQGTAVDGRLGITYAVLNNILFIAGRGGNMQQFDGGVATTNVTGEPAGILINNYRDRLYVVGDGSTGTNGSSRRISFSARGDGTSWTTASDFFDVEDQLGEAVTGTKSFNDNLGIFKTNSTFVYNEVQLKNTIRGVGAYTEKVVKEIDKSLFTFCPNGIFETNLFSAEQIGEPVREYWKSFYPIYDSVSKRVCTNTFAWTFEDRYFLYIGTITNPAGTNVVLEFNTRNRSWTVHELALTMSHINLLRNYNFGDNQRNTYGAIFGGSTTGIMFRFFESRYLDGQATPVVQGGDIYPDFINDNAGAAISSYLETPMYDLDNPQLFKKFKRLRVYAERGNWSVEYRVENEEGISDYRPLGTTGITNKVMQFSSDAQGWRIGFRVSSINEANVGIFNGFVFEKTDVVSRA